MIINFESLSTWELAITIFCVLFVLSGIVVLGGAYSGGDYKNTIKRVSTMLFVFIVLLMAYSFMSNQAML